MLLVVEKGISVANNEIFIEVVDPNNQHINWKVLQNELSLIRNDAMSPWLIAPPQVRNSIRRMQRYPKLGDSYEVMMGIKTGNDNIYIVTDIKGTATGNLITVTSTPNPKTKKKISFNIEPYR